jgi:hypothetical protein
MTTTAEGKTTKSALQKELDVRDAREQLLRYLSKESTVYTVLRKVAPSGMSRSISLKIVHYGKIVDITYYASLVLGWPLVEVNGSRALRVGGCGMDMGFHTVYTLSRILFREEGSLKDAGYSLNHAWA